MRKKIKLSLSLLIWIALLCFMPHLNCYASEQYYTIQTGSFISLELAQNQFESLKQKLDYFNYLRIEKIGNYYTVRLGKYRDKATGEQLLRSIKILYPTAVILKAYIHDNRITKLHVGVSPADKTEEQPLISESHENKSGDIEKTKPDSLSETASDQSTPATDTEAPAVPDNLLDNKVDIKVFEDWTEKNNEKVNLQLNTLKDEIVFLIGKVEKRIYVYLGFVLLLFLVIIVLSYVMITRWIKKTIEDKTNETLGLYKNHLSDLPEVIDNYTALFSKYLGSSDKPTEHQDVSGDEKLKKKEHLKKQLKEFKELLAQAKSISKAKKLLDSFNTLEEN